MRYDERGDMNIRGRWDMNKSEEVCSRTSLSVDEGKERLKVGKGELESWFQSVLVLNISS